MKLFYTTAFALLVATAMARKPSDRVGPVLCVEAPVYVLGCSSCLLVCVCLNLCLHLHPYRT